ncbi:hypothetical protein OPT61_g387 [Boeremia exigua]|uniref:Uncharacterized protein n=1 Tax=Boeremia exigua TaxID=749465 RepID=A0ACC2IU18_9PLEO|nr:hypothetical protein OPT61_g387 [Boeremia exigua]
MPPATSLTNDTAHAGTAMHTTESTLPQHMHGVPTGHLQVHSSGQSTPNTKHQAMVSTPAKNSDCAQIAQPASSPSQLSDQINAAPSFSPIPAPQFGRTYDQRSRDATSSFSHETSNNGQQIVAPEFDTSSFTRSTTPSLVPHQIRRTQSRLPPSTVARKAPRKATYIPTPANEGSPRVTKLKSSAAKPRRQPGIPSHALPSPAAARKPPKERPGQTEPSTPKESPTVEVLVEKKDQSFAIDSIEVGHETDLKTIENIMIWSPTPSPHRDMRRDTQPFPAPPHDQIQSPREIKTHQLRFEYDMTPKLESVKRALGRDNWTEYLLLTESLVLGEMADREFQIEVKKIFQVPDATMYNRIQEIVLRRMAIRE